MNILKTIQYYRLCSLTEWRIVKGHPRYIVSCNGEVLCWSWKLTGKSRLCRLSANSYGYLRVHIDGVLKLVHRIVAEAFISNHESKPCIDHIDTNRQNNCVENLRWVTHLENSNNMLSIKNMSENAPKPMLGKFSAEHNRSIPIVQLTLDGQFIKKWACGSDASRELGINQSSITECCRGRYKSAGGFCWMYYSEWIKLQRTP